MANGTDQTNPAPVNAPVAAPGAPDVNPAGGASSSWGPGEIVLDPNQDKTTRMFDALHQGGVAVTDGVSNNGWVHYSKVDQFLKDNPSYEKGTFFTGPDGNLAGVVKASQAGTFQKANPSYKAGVPQSAGWDPNASRFASWRNFADAQRKAVEQGANMWGGLGVVPKLAKSLTFDTAQAAAQDVGKYINAEATAPTAPSWYRNYLAPAAEASGQFLEGSYDPKQFALMAALGKVPGGPLANTALRGLQGYFTYQQLHGAYQQGNAAQDAFQRGDTAEGVRQLTSALYSGGMAYDIANQTAKEVARNPQGALDDLRRSVPTIKGTAVGDFAVDLLRQSAEKQLQRVLTQGGGTKKEKAIAERVAPEMAARGVLAATREGLEEKSAEQADIAGQKLDDFYQSLPQNTRIPTQPLLDHFEQAKQEFVAPDSGAVLDQNGIDKVDALKQVVQQFGSDVSVNDIVALRRLWDQQVAASGPGHLLPADETTAIAIKKEAANAIRGELAKQFPDLDQLNKEFSFWKGVNTVMSATNLRKGGHAWFSLQDLLFGTGGAGLLAHLGLAAGGAGVGAAVGLSKAMKSTAWNTVSAKAKYQIANLLADGNVQEAARVAAKETGGAEPAGAATPKSPVVPPWTNSGQGNLPFGGPTPAAAAAPAEEPSGAGPTAPSAETGQDVPSPGVPYAIPGAEVGQVPARNQPIVPDFMRPPEAQALAGKLAKQKAAVDQAATLAEEGDTKKETYKPLEEDSYVPELEPENLRGGKNTQQVYKVNGEYTPERKALHERIIQKILGSGAGKDSPHVIYLGGGAASGKTEAVLKSLRAKYPDAVIIDPDEIKQQLPEWNTLKRSDPLRGAFRLHEESSDIGNEAIARAAQTGRDIIVDKVNGNGPKVINEMQNFRNKGYEVEARYADRDVPSALQAMVARFRSKGRWVPPYILDANHAEAAGAFHEVAPVADQSSLHMARGGPHQLVYENGNVYNNELYREHLRKGGLADDGLRLRSGPEDTGSNGQGLRGVRPEEPGPPPGNRGPQSTGGGESEGGPPTEQAPEAQVEPTLPGMEHVPAARAQAAAEQQGQQLSQQAAAPAGSIEGAAGEMERLSPLFRSAEASGQGEMFQSQAQPERGMPPPGEVGRVPVSDLKVDPHRFQYKAGTDVEGVSPLLKETKVWNPDLAGVISVWRDPADGQNYVVNGHHRFELAKRLGVPDMVVRHIVANTAEEARTIGAMQNIAEGRGTAIDAAKFFRQTDRGPQELQQKGISLSEGKVHDGLALAALDPDIFQRVVNGGLKEGRGVTIGESGLDHAQQRSLMDTLDKRERGGKNISQGQLAEFIRLQKGAGQTTESQTDLFGTHEVARSLGFEKAEVSDYVKQQIAREKRTFGFVSTGGRAEQLASAGAGNIDVERSGALSNQAAQAEEVYNKLSTRGGPISDILDEASRRLAGGENAGTVKADAYAKIRQAISETLGRKLE